MTIKEFRELPNDQVRHYYEKWIKAKHKQSGNDSFWEQYKEEFEFSYSSLILEFQKRGFCSSTSKERNNDFQTFQIYVPSNVTYKAHSYRLPDALHKALSEYCNSSYLSFQLTLANLLTKALKEENVIIDWHEQ